MLEMPAPFEAFFLPMSAPVPGQRFCIYHPARTALAKGAILYIHPFAEEMNKSRRMAAIQSRALAEAGYAVLQIDLLGCGDSSGDFGDASWQDWIDDVLQGAAWLRERAGAPLWLWGLRVGCLLAVDAARQMQEAPHFLFWAPSASGKQSLQQFLRMKAAADIGSGNAKSILDGIRNELAQGRAVEVGGYPLSPALASGLEASSLNPITASSGGSRLEWLEVSSREDATMSPVGTKTLGQWQQAGFDAARGQVVPGTAFWQTTEIEDAPALVDATLAAINGAVPASNARQEASV